MPSSNPADAGFGGGGMSPFTGLALPTAVVVFFVFLAFCPGRGDEARLGGVREGLCWFWACIGGVGIGGAGGAVLPFVICLASGLTECNVSHGPLGICMLKARRTVQIPGRGNGMQDCRR